MEIAFLGDLHLNVMPHHVHQLRAAISSGVGRVIQVGDYSEDPVDFKLLSGTDPYRVSILGGNHDHWPTLIDLPHHLPRYGYQVVGDKKLFWLEGAYSIDSLRRPRDTSWFPAHEQLHFEQLYQAYIDYMKTKPDILVAHEACTEAIEVLGIKGLPLMFPFGLQSQTQQTLQKMVEYHRPQLVVNGHWHTSAVGQRDGTKFLSLGLGECVVVDTTKDL